MNGDIVALAAVLIGPALMLLLILTAAVMVVSSLSEAAEAA